MFSVFNSKHRPSKVCADTILIFQMRTPMHRKSK